MQRKTFWACAGCDKTFRTIRGASRHNMVVHDSYAGLEEFSPELQQRLIDGHDEFRKQLQAAIARVDAMEATK